jgi:repressor LexA
MKPLTDRQSQVLDYLKDHIRVAGYPPTLREIAGHFSLSGPRAAVKHLDALVRKGYIVRKKGLSRGIEMNAPHTEAGAVHAGPDQAGSSTVPLLGAVPAGPPELAVEEAGSSLVLDDSIAGEGTFLLKVEGDSMAGDHILPGDIIVVMAQETAEDGEMVVVLVEDDATLKRFRRSGKEVHLIPSNPDYETIVLDGNQGNVRIIGKVRAVIRRTGH